MLQSGSKLLSGFVRRTGFCSSVRRAKVNRKEVCEKKNVSRALEHFDDVYGSFYGRLWPSIRLALLSQPKHCALINYFGDHEEAAKKLKDLGCVEVQESYRESLQCWQDSGSKGRKVPRAVVEKSVEMNIPQLAEELPSERVITLEGVNSALFNFVPATKMKGMEDWVEESDQLQYVEESHEFSPQKLSEGPADFPTLLKAFVFPRGDVTKFNPPKQSSFGTSSYYLMDAASLLPVIALNLKPLDTVLDLCAAPGGKSLSILQTLYPSLLVSNDASYSRLSRFKGIVTQYIGKSQCWKDRLKIRQCDARDWSEFEAFDKVLVDVPCTIDRHSVNEEDNNLFSINRIKERIKLPELQADILCAGVRACKPGGTTVYSTCSLSPIQNDGVVYMALKKLKEVYGINVVVKDLTATMKNFDSMIRFAPASLLRYGQLAIPSLPLNYGPMYVAKLQRGPQ